MEVKIKTTTGQDLKSVKLPPQFSERIRPDVVKRAVLAIHSHKRQPYGAASRAGKRASAKLSRRRRDFRGSYGIGISRVPRKALNHRGTRFYWVGAFAPGTVGGRRAHPPKAEKIWDHKINKKERRLAIRSALAASVMKDLVVKRGHIVNEYPLVIEDKAEGMGKTKDVSDMLTKLGLTEEMERVNVRKIRAGKGKSRGRKYKRKKGPLFVVSKDCKLRDASCNLPGVDCVIVSSLNADVLAPGSEVGRLTIYTQGAIERLEKEALFTDTQISKKKENKGDMK